MGFPDEVDRYIEGATKQVLVNAYERNNEARSACLAHYGYSCVICGFNFESTYGAIGQNFAHVHHIRPISSIGQEHTIDPIEDLRPVCPNCHSMLHKSNPPFTISEMQEIMAREANA